MARKKVSGVATKEGVSNELITLDGATVTCFQAGTSTAIDMYLTEGAPTPSVITTDSEGYFEFWIECIWTNKRIKTNVTKGADVVEVDYIFSIEYDGIIVINSSYSGLLNGAILLSDALAVLDGLSAGDIGAEPAFTKNTAFNKDFGTGAGEVVEGNDSRISAKSPLFLQGTDYSSNRDNYRVRSNGTGGSWNFTFHVPSYVSSVSAIKAVGIPNGDGVDVDIDLFSSYGAEGEAYNNHSESNLTSVYSFSADQIWMIDVSSVFSSLAGGDFAGIQIDHNGIGTTIDYLGVLIYFS